MFFFLANRITFCLRHLNLKQVLRIEEPLKHIRCHGFVSIYISIFMTFMQCWNVVFWNASKHSIDFVCLDTSIVNHNHWFFCRYVNIVFIRSLLLLEMLRSFVLLKCDAFLTRFANLHKFFSERSRVIVFLEHSVEGLKLSHRILHMKLWTEYKFGGRWRGKEASMVEFCANIVWLLHFDIRMTATPFILVYHCCHSSEKFTTSATHQNVLKPLFLCSAMSHFSTI